MSPTTTDKIGLPFENRWASGSHGRAWHQALERLGVDQVRTCLVVSGTERATELDELQIPAGFVRDWLHYHEYAERRERLRWRRAILLASTVAAIGACIAATPVLLRWF